MSVATQAIPTGTYTDDGIHSSIGFEVKHMVVATFRGRFDEYKATLTVDENGDAKLVGIVQTDSVLVKDENLAGHLQSPDFFDAERTPQLTFESTKFDVEDGRVTVEGDLTIKGHTERVTGTGTVTDLVEDFAGNHKLGLSLETVIDRTNFGLDWNAPLPKGGFALSDDVKLVIDLELVKAEA
jgi:polyisoprenoid-binding protein YceI